MVSMLLLAIVTAMFVSAAFSLGPASMARGRKLSQQQAAERAMRTGLDYAIARIRATPGGLWRAKDPYSVLTDGLVVTEGEGQVVGWVKDGAHWARFRFNFNRQDGSGGLDGLDDAATAPDAAVGVCVNNLVSNIDLPVFPQGQGPTATARFRLAPHTMLLKVEGCCGSVPMANGAPSRFSGTPTRVASESILGLDLGRGVSVDSVASAAGDLSFTVGQSGKVRFDSQGAGGARLRTKTGLSVLDSQGVGAALESPQGEIRTSNNGNQVGTTQVASQIRREQENAGDSFYRISKVSAPKLEAGAISLAGGVYEVDLDGQQQIVVRHFEMSYQDYKTAKLAGSLPAGTVVNLPSSIETTVNSNGLVEVKFTKDTTLDSASSVTDFAVVPSKGAFQEGETPVGGALPVPVGTYLVQLANQIHSDFDAVLGDNIAGATNFSTSAGLAALLNASEGPSGSVTTPGGMVLTYQDSGTTIVSTQNWNSSWDGLGSQSPYGNGQYQFGSLELAQFFWTRATTPEVAAALASYMGPPPAGFGEGSPPDPEAAEGASDSSKGLAVKDLKIKLSSQAISGDVNIVTTINEEGVTLRFPGNVVLAGRLDGQGGAVVADGNISLLGNGVDLKAGQTSNKLNLYSAGNIVIDGFAFDDSSSVYNNVNLEGVAYAWGGLTVNVGKLGSKLDWGNFTLRGAMVAFGGDPEQEAGSTDSSSIQIVARDADLLFDGAYLLNLQDSPVKPNSSFVVRAYQQY